MRQIKIRIWDKKLNIYWQPIELDRLLKYLIFQNCPNADAYRALKDHFNEMVFEQFTGLLDKNGKEIYEGDIILLQSISIYSTEQRKYKVSFDAGMFCGNCYLNPLWEMGGSMIADNLPTCKAEIIGNIHETENY